MENRARDSLTFWGKKVSFGNPWSYSLLNIGFFLFCPKITWQCNETFNYQRWNTLWKRKRKKPFQNMKYYIKCILECKRKKHRSSDFNCRSFGRSAKGKGVWHKAGFECRFTDRHQGTWFTRTDKNNPKNGLFRTQGGLKRGGSSKFFMIITLSVYFVYENLKSTGTAMQFLSIDYAY